MVSDPPPHLPINNYVDHTDYIQKFKAIIPYNNLPPGRLTEQDID